MQLFEYQALDRQGQAIKGTLIGDSLDAAARELSAKGLLVQSVVAVAGYSTGTASEPRKENPTQRQNGELNPPVVQPKQEFEAPSIDPRSKLMTQLVGPLVGQVALAHLGFFFRQLGVMLNAGVNPVQALETLSRQTRSGKLREIILELRGHTMAGRPMTAGLQRYPEVFSPMMVSMIRAGEEGGFLDESLKQTAEYIEREIELRNLIRRETFYPKMVIILSILIIGGANLFIAFLGLKSPLWSPLTTLATWIVLGPLLVGLFLFFRVGLKQPHIKQRYDQILLAIPYLGGVVRDFAMAKFGRAFGALYKGGVPIHKGLKLAADACGNEAIRAQIYPAVGRLEEGEGITHTLRETGAFTPIVLDMTATGEATGNLDQMLVKMSEFYEDDAGVRARQLALILGVVCLLAVAVYVAYVVISFYTGYFQDVFKQVDSE